jgi:drug/metabolite transporter (DMT)-like permease
MPVLMLVYLAISGIIGIGFGDSAYFAALNNLGTRITLLLSVLAPPMAAGVAYILLGETIAPAGWIGILITLAGVAWVITEQTGGENPAGKKILWRGLIWGLLANLAQAVGAVISRMALTQSNITALQTGVIRLAAGSFSLLFWMTVRREPIGGWIKTGSRNKLWLDVFIAVFFGACLAIWGQQIALQNTYRSSAGGKDQPASSDRGGGVHGRGGVIVRDYLRM